LLLVFVALALAAGAYLAFPVYDDGYMMLFLREPGVDFRHVNRDRPIPGLLHQALVSLGGQHAWFYAGINVVLWLVLALEARALFRRLFPDLKEYGMLGACLTLAPVVVQVQVSSLVVAATVVLFTILSYAAILLCLKSAEQPGMGYLAGGLALAAAASYSCEYATAALLAGATVLTGIGLSGSEPSLRSRLVVRAGALSAVAVLAYLLFLKTADFAIRPDVDPGAAVGRSWEKVVRAALGSLAGLWYSIVGAYGSALARLAPSWSSKSSLIGFMFALVALGLAVAALPRLASSVARFSGRTFYLALAILIGLGPAALMGRAPMLTDYESRMRVPILPIAAALTLYLALSLVHPDKRWAPVALLGAAMGYATWTTIYSNVHEVQILNGLGSLLKPYAESKPEGFTVAVVSLPRMQNEMTAHVTSRWPEAFERRFWIYNAETARSRFGTRTDCRATPTIDEQVRPIVRKGPISQILWVELGDAKPASVEPYCLHAPQSELASN
jgi:hypothetical protein